MVHSFICEIELPKERRNISEISIPPPPLPFVALLLLSNAPNNPQTALVSDGPSFIGSPRRDVYGCWDTRQQYVNDSPSETSIGDVLIVS